jgi:uncharacterized protein involved in cysteine biosynthesis
VCALCGAVPSKRRVAGFGDGFSSVLRGLTFLARTPRTKRYAAVPIALTLTAFAIAFWALWNATEPVRRVSYSAEWMPAWMQAVLTFFLGAIVFLVFCVVLWAGAAILTTAVAAPFLDVLVGRVDEVKFGKERTAGGTWMEDSAFTVVQSLLTLGFLLPLNAAAFIAAWIPPLGPPVAFFLLSTAAGFGAFDFAASRRRWTFGQKLRVASANFPALLGIGIALVLLTLVPCVGWMVAIPAAAAAGGLAVYHLDLTDAAK